MTKTPLGEALSVTGVIEAGKPLGRGGIGSFAVAGGTANTVPHTMGRLMAGRSGKA